MTNPQPWTPLHARLHQTLRQRKLLKQKDRLLVAVSGGQDSLCLLKLLLDLQSKWFWEIAIAHCDHCWSSDAGIADAVERIATSWGIPFHLKKALRLPFDFPSTSLRRPSGRALWASAQGERSGQATETMKETEAAARKWRYEALIEIALEQGFELILTGHTLSDRAETLLYNLIRGAGADGMAALTWNRFLTPEINLVRPILNISRRETGEFCRQFQLPVIEDRVNQNLKYARNRIRADLLPYLKTQFNPQVETTLAQTAELLRAEGEYLENAASQLLEEAISPDGTSLNRICLGQAHLAIQRRTIRQFLHKAMNKAPNFEQIEAVTQLIDAPNRTRTSSLAKGAISEVRGNFIIFKPL